MPKPDLRASGANIAQAIQEAAAHYREGRLAEAERLCSRVLKAHPGQFDALHLSGLIKLQAGKASAALALIEAALKVNPAVPQALANRALALSALNRDPEALASIDQALALAPNNFETLNNRGNVLLKLARPQEALALLTLGDYRQGFKAYEARWLRTGMPSRRRNFGKPLWLGEYPLARKTILLHAEQGLGDTIQFVRYAAPLTRSGAKVAIEVPPELTSLLARVEGVGGVVASGAPLPPFDVHCPMGSLPLALRTEPATIPADVPYLNATPERIGKWRERIERLPAPRIAIAWAGRATHVNDRNRSIALARLEPLLALGQVSFVRLQREMRSE